MRGRLVNGILLLDKPLGLSSNAALQQVKRLFDARKAGHTGSLDPLASGLLPICFGEATKLSGFLLDADKHYQAVIQLGVTTRTGDAEGEVLERRDTGSVTRLLLDEVLLDFNGVIEQVPPMFSALKQNGQPLYKLARQGIEVERKARQVTIHDLQLVKLDGDSLEIRVHCSKGTYIRTLAEDIGERLGCGAHITALRRDGVGTFDVQRMVTMTQLEALAGQVEALDALLLAPDQALMGWPEIRVSDDAAYFLKRGQPVLVSQAPAHGLVRVYAAAEHFLGVGQILDDGRLAPKRLLSL
jgi:tRNA pseudouridine55 synthase